MIIDFKPVAPGWKYDLDGTVYDVVGWGLEDEQWNPAVYLDGSLKVAIGSGIVFTLA